MPRRGSTTWGQPHALVTLGQRVSRHGCQRGGTGGEDLIDQARLRLQLGIALARLGDEGLQSDTRFAEAFVQSRINQGKGPVRIRADLAQRGIQDGVVEGALEASACDWFELAGNERRKKFGSLAPGDFKEKARQMRFLQYRGFEQDHICIGGRSIT